MVLNRMKISKKVIFFASAFSILLIILLSICQFPKKQKVWTTESWKLHPSDSNSERNIADGPRLDLPPGRYRLQWQMDLDGEAEIQFLNTNDVKMDPERIVVHEDNSWDEIYFDIKEPVHNFGVHVNVISGSEPELYSLRLTSPNYSDHIITIAFLLLFMILWMNKIRMGMTEDAKRNLIILAIAVFVSSVPAFRNALVSGPDSAFHACRVLNVADGLAAFEFPVRISSFLYNRYGALTSVFYPDLFLYPVSVLILLGASITYSMQVLFIGVNICTAYVTYSSCKRLFHECEPALCASILYVMSSYRLYTTFAMQAAGAVLGIAFLPLFISAVVDILCDNYNRWPYLTLGAFCIFESHLITALLSAGFAFVMVLLFLKKLIKEPERIAALVKAVLLTVCVCAFTLIPLLQELLTNEYTQPVQFGFSSSSMNLPDIMDYVTGIGYLPMIFGCLFLAMDSRYQSLKYKILLFMGFLAILLSSEFFPWTIVERFLGTLPSIIQFPNRFWVYGVSILCICGALSAVAFLGKIGKPSVLLLVVSAVSLFPVFDRIFGRPAGISFGEGANPFCIIPEYQLMGTDLSATRERQLICSEESIEVTNYERFATGAELHVNSREAGSITLPIFAFDKYQVQIGNQTVPYTRGVNNRITFEVPAGSNQKVLVRFVEPVLWRVSEIISVVAIAFLLFRIWKIKKSLSCTE